MGPSATSPRAEFTSKPAIPDFESLPDRYHWPTENSRGYKLKEQLSGTERPLRIVHLGCGAAGICLAKFLPERLNNVSFTCYDKNADIGGTWLENRYPGCACDIPSVDYQFTWARNPNWSHFYSGSPEIWQYFKDIVDRFELQKHFKLNHIVEGAYWDGDKGMWNIHVRNLITGEAFIDGCDVFINGGGLLNHWKWPEIEGLHDFKGTLCHTARYDENTVLDGKRVAVIGIGSSGVQVISSIVNKVSQLYTWIRTPTWITAGFAQKYAGPNGANFAYTKEQHEAWTENYPDYLQYCKDVEDELNQRFKFVLINTPEAEEAKKFSTKEMGMKLAGRKDIMDKIIPTDFGIGCRRPTPGNGFLEALTATHVTTFTNEMKKITEKGFLDHDGNEHEVDIIICATGFNTSWIPRFPIVAKGINIQDEFKDFPLSYLSSGVPDIPNYFTVGGPYGPLGHGSFLPLVERLISNYLKVVKKMQVENIKSIAPKREICEMFREHADLFFQRTAWVGPCTSWFKNGKKNGPLTIFPGSRLLFLELYKEPRYEDYNIEYQSGNSFGFLGNGFMVTEYDGSDLSAYLGTKDNPGSLMPKAADETHAPPHSPESLLS